MRRALLLLLCACGPAAGGPGPVSPVAGEPQDGRILAQAERRLLAEAEDPTRSGPIPRPRLPRAVRSLEELDGRIAATERGLIGLAPGDDEEPVLMLELATYHAERAFVVRATGQADAVREERALELVRRLTDEARFRGFRRLDEALLLLAEICERRGEVATMKAAYLRLMSEHSGMFIPIAVLALADQQYAVGEVESARALYDKVRTFTDSPLHAYALYRLAWCDRVVSSARARDGFLLAIQAAASGRGGTPAEARILRAAARLDLGRPGPG